MKLLVVEGEDLGSNSYRSYSLNMLNSPFYDSKSKTDG